MSLEKKLKQKYQWEVTEPNIGFNQGLSFALRELGRVADKIPQLKKEVLDDLAKRISKDNQSAILSGSGWLTVDAKEIEKTVDLLISKVLGLLVEQKEEQK